ncbi:MAG: radical SAM protein [Candidatus Delongbacteria bacterium]|jgi:wyosine [tRNA(Phe)-imidazoG37] synthetase (radical SAM superfamily)|nr:radical SAM protein [Candidatus Delongbacteria bacterium]
MYKHIFGPVPSRRLGMSLGIDLVPHKVCSLNCIYCECGKTTDLTLERKEYIPYDEVITELTDYMKNNSAPDFITFSGSGEPTLNSRIGDIISFIKENYSDIKVAVLTNGTLFPDKKVRDELLKADLVLPSFDAASELSFKRINRGNSSINLEEYLNSLIEFRKEFKGTIWLEILIIPGYNDSKEDLELLKNAVLKIDPDSVQLNTLDRPGAIDGIRAATHEELQKIVDTWKLDNVEIIAKVQKRKDSKSFSKDIESTILQTISRRPCTLEDMVDILGLHANEINKYLDTMEADGKISHTRQERGIFYQIDKK